MAFLPRALAFLAPLAVLASGVTVPASAAAPPYTLAWLLADGQCPFPLPIVTAEGPVELFLALQPALRAQGNPRGQMIRLNPSPEERWRFTEGAGPVSYGAAALAQTQNGPVVIFGAEDGAIRALGATTGSLLWKCQLASPVRSSVAVADINADGAQEAVIASTDGSVYALSLAGQVLWRAALGGPISCSPALMDVDGEGIREVFLGCDDGFVYCVSGRDGAVRWRFLTGWAVTGSPLVGDLERKGRHLVLVGSDDGYLYCLDAVAGHMLWRWRTGAPVTGACAVADVAGDQALEVLFGSDNLYCLSSQGMLLWTHEDGRRFVTSPVVADLEGFGRASVIAGSDDLLCLDASTGEERWQWTFRDESLFDPLLVDLGNDGTLEVIVSSTDGYLWCFTPLPGTPRQVPLWIRSRANTQNTGNIPDGLAYAASRGLAVLPWQR